MLLPALVLAVAQTREHARPMNLNPPVAKRQPTVREIHGDRRVDDYHWLREKSSPEVRACLEAENAYADAVMAPAKELQERLYQEMLSHIKQTDVNVPYRHGGWLYYSRTEEGKQYPIHCRKRAEDAPEEVTLDLNELARGEKFMALGACAVTDDGGLLAYSTDVTGFRQYTLRVKDLRSGRTLPDRAERVGSVVWAADGKTLFYTVEDHAKRQYRLYRHVLGEKDDFLVFEEKDARFNLHAFRARSRSCLFLVSASNTTSEARFLPADRPDGEWRLIEPREHEHEYYPDHRGDLLYIRTNSGGRNFRLVAAPVDSPGRTNWKELVGHRKDTMLEEVELFRDHAVLMERRMGIPRVRVLDLRSRDSHYVKFPEPVYEVSPENNREWETTRFRYAYQSLVTPRSIFDYDMEKRESTLLKETEVPGGFSRANYCSERIYAKAPDGTRVPISLVYRRGLKRDARAPLYLYGYGAYGYPLSAAFNSNRLTLLDRGFVYAIAHVRGGGELGKRWHDDGRMFKKRNTFTDFIACAEHLLARKYGARERLVIEGASAGGLLMGAVTNMRPDLFRAVLSKVPFVDVINTMLDDNLPLTVAEYEEWGNPNQKDDYEYLKTYCPYTNLRPVAYPAILIRTAFNDSQVMYWEPAKYAAKLRTLKTDSNPLLLRTNLEAGHGGASGRYDYLREIAHDFAFALMQVGIAR